MIYCPNCGSQLKASARFCKYCGYKLNTKVTPSEPTTTSLHDSPILSQPPVTNTVPSGTPFSSPHGETLDEPESYAEPRPIGTSEPVVEEEFPAIPSDVIDLLAGRLLINDIKDSMVKVLEEIEKIEKKLDLGLITAGEAQELIQEKNEELKRLKNQKKSFSDEKLPFEQYYVDLLAIKDKLMKLEELKQQGKIKSEAVYQKLFDEYNGEYTRLKEGFEEETRRLKQWERQLAEDIQNYKDHAELTLTRAELGEITEEEAKKEKENYETEAKRRGLARKVITQLLEEYQNVV